MRHSRLTILQLFVILGGFLKCSFSQPTKLTLIPYNENCKQFLGTFDTKDSTKLYRYSDSLLECRLSINSIRSAIYQKEIRVYITNSSSDSGRLVIFKENEYAWDAEIFYFRFFLKGTKAVGSYSKFENVTPESGWVKFNEILNSEYLNNLKVPSNIQLAEDCSGGDQVTIEIADRKSHSIFPYYCFYINKSVNEYNQVSHLLSFIEHQFHVNITRNMFIN